MTQSFNGTCRACDDKCLVCIGTITNCTSCKSIYKLYGNSCVDVCPAGTYEGSLAGVNNIACVDCSVSCLTCSLLGTNCTSCASNTYLWNFTCVATCPTQTYLNVTLNACVKCQYPCVTCASAANNCTTCTTGYVHNTDNTCSSQCSDGSYLHTDPSTNVTSCVTCALTNCKTCDSTQCYKCSTNYYSYTAPSSDIITSCISTCPSNYFAQESTSSCEKCVDLCMTCTSVTNCQKCVIPYFLYNDQCLPSCPEQTY